MIIKVQLKKVLLGVLIIGFTMLTFQNSVSAQSQNSSGLSEERTKRIEIYKNQQDVRLSFARQQAIQARCASAQKFLQRYEERLANYGNRQAEVYRRVGERLEALSVRLDAESGQTLAQLSQNFISQTEVVKSTTNEVMQVIDDAKSINCEEDPTTFYAIIQQLRTAQQSLNVANQVVRGYFFGNITDMLKTLQE